MRTSLIDLSRANAPTAPTPEEIPPKDVSPEEASSELPEPEARPAEPAKPRPKRAATERPDVAVVAPTKAEPPPAAAFEQLSTLSVRIPASLHKRLRLHCIGVDIEIQQFVQEALTQHLGPLQGGPEQQSQ